MKTSVNVSFFSLLINFMHGMIKSKILEGEWRKRMNLMKNRTKIQMVLTVLVIFSIVRQFFLGSYHNMFL